MDGDARVCGVSAPDAGRGAHVEARAGRALGRAGRGPWRWLWKEEGGGPAPPRPSRRSGPPPAPRRPPTPAAARGGRQSDAEPRRRGPRRRPLPGARAPGRPSRAGSGARRSPLQVKAGRLARTRGLGGFEGRTRPRLPLRLSGPAGQHLRPRGGDEMGPRGQGFGARMGEPFPFPAPPIPPARAAQAESRIKPSPPFLSQKWGLQQQTAGWDPR